jgi:ureidoglycolate lyase
MSLAGGIKMRSVSVKHLSTDDFAPYGSFVSMIDPGTARIGAPPIEFYRDMLPVNLGSANQASFSICRVEQRKLEIDTSEYHTACGEGILPLDGDVLVHVGPATPEDLPLDEIEVFVVPRGTLVSLKPGVWHHAPFPVSGDPVNVVIVLPERTYANDCVVVEHRSSEKITIDTDSLK